MAADKNFDATIKKLNKKLEDELEKKYAKLLGNNSKLMANAAKKEVKRITEKIHRKIVANGNKEIQSIVNVYDDTIRASRKTLDQLSQKLKQIDIQTDKLKGLGRLPKDHVSKQAQAIERKLKEVQNQILIQERAKEKSVRAYISNNVHIQDVEKQALELQLQALNGSKTQRMRILQLQDKIGKAELEKKKAEENSGQKGVFGDFRSALGSVATSQGFGFKQEIGLIKGLFSPFSNLVKKSKTNRDVKDKNELSLLLESVRNNSEIYEDVGRKLGAVIPKIAEAVETEKEIIDSGALGGPPRKRNFFEKIHDKTKGAAFGSLLDILNPMKPAEVQVKEHKVGNTFLEKIFKLLLHMPDVKKESKGFIGSLFHGALTALAALTAAKWGMKLFGLMFPKEAKAVSGVVRMAAVLGKRKLRGMFRSATGKKFTAGVKKAGSRIEEHLPGVARVGKMAGGKIKGVSFDDVKDFVQHPIRKTVVAGARGYGGFLKHTAGKAFKKTAGRILRKVPLVGGLFTAGITYAATGSATRATTAGLGSVGGTVTGALIGAALGSVIPVVGTFLGGAIGGIIGDIVGSKIGDNIGKSMEANYRNRRLNDGSTKTYDLEQKRMEMNMADSTSVALEQSRAANISSVEEADEKGMLGNMNILKTFLKEDFAGTLASKIAGEFKSSNTTFPLFAVDSHQSALRRGG